MKFLLWCVSLTVGIIIGNILWYSHFSPKVTIHINKQIKIKPNIVLVRIPGENEVQKVLNISKTDLVWLALNIFHEARGENLHGKMAVAFVTLNRVVHRSWPNTIKEVVTQPYQFSWYNSGKVPAIKKTQLEKWRECKRVAELSIELYNSMAESKEFDVDGLVKGSDHYFATYIPTPSWAKKMEFQAKVGNHLFYKM